MFYLPQKPYSVLGSLRAQLSYPAPEEEAKKITHEELKELLDEVELGYLLDRKVGVDDEEDVNWEAILSLGEKQRLAAARLFYHSPKFAILDECSSGISALMEKRIYETCERRGITCITISHRPVLEQYHDVVLNITADGEGGWTWRETGRKTKAKTEIVDDGAAALGGYSAKYMDSKSGNDAEERARLKKRSAKYVALAEQLGSNKKEMPHVSSIQRLKDVLAHFAPMGMVSVCGIVCISMRLWSILCSSQLTT